MRNILNNIEANRIIGLALLAISVAVYSYYYPSTIDSDNTTEIKIELASKPDYDKPNGDNVPKITFNVVGYDKVMDISHCALDIIKKQRLTNLEVGSNLTLLVNKSELNSEKTPLMYSPIHIYGIQLSNGETLFTLDTYNACERGSWKRILILGGVIATILTLILISEVRNKG